METSIAKQIPDESSFSLNSFEHAQRVAKMLSSSNLIPKEYQGNVQNTMIAMEMANRIGASPLMVMQNLYIIQGRPSWSSSFIIAVLNNCKRFSPLKFTVTGSGETLTCKAFATELNTGETITGPIITMQMAKDEGWFTKPGSKWKTMPELMIQYRAAAFFGRLYAPELLMGMHSSEEVYDMAAVSKPDNSAVVADRMRIMIEEAETPAQLKDLKPNVPEELYDLFNQRVADLGAVQI